MVRNEGCTVHNVNPQFLQSMQILSMQRKNIQAFWYHTLYPTAKQLPIFQKSTLPTKRIFFECLTLKMEALCYSETCLTVYQPTGSNIPKHAHFHQQTV
jgi:hypothetical protein